MFTPMRRRVACVLLACGSIALAQALPEFKSGKSDSPLSESSPQATDAEVKARLRLPDPIPAYDPSAEKFELTVPEGYSHDKPWGLLVWISSGDKPGVPAGWEDVLAKHKMLTASPYKAGGGRNANDRFRIASDIVHNLRKRFNIDPKRVYVAGAGAGGKIASIAAVAWSDVFVGAYTINGIQYYKNVPGDPGKVYPGVYTPTFKSLSAARKDGRFVFAVDVTDKVNGVAAQRFAERGFKKDSFRNVKVLEAAPKEGASVELLTQALEFLDKGK